MCFIWNKACQLRKMTSLRVERHPRGHIASCNGRVELLNTRVVSCADPSGNAAENALTMDVWARREKERKAQELESFQRRVKHRVSQREREKQREIARKSTELVQCEQRAAEKAVKLDKIKVQKSIEIGHDVEDVKVIASAKASHIPQQPGRPTASQIARRNLLMKKGSSESTMTEQRTKETLAISDDSAPHKDRGYYQEVNQSSDCPISESQPQVSKTCPTTSSLERRSNLKLGESGSKILKQTTSTLHKFTASGQLEYAQKKQAAQQYHLFRKLYSDLERVQARQKQLQLTHNQRVEKLKQKKEASRRVAEDDVNCVDSCSAISTEAAEDQQRAVQWAELVARETRRQQIQKNQEMDRYLRALRARLKEQVESRKLDVPPLCACGGSLWDASPDTCANNCSFYKNPKEYARALSNLLISLEL